MLFIVTIKSSTTESLFPSRICDQRSITLQVLDWLKENNIQFTDYKVDLEEYFTIKHTKFLFNKEEHAIMLTLAFAESIVI